MLTLILTMAMAQEEPSFQGAQVPTGLNAQRFRPTLDGQRTLWVDDAKRGQNKRFFVRPLFHYTRQPLVYRFDDGNSRGIVNNIVQGDLMMGFSYDRLRVGVNLPVYLYADGDGTGSESGLGDLAADVKLNLVENDSIGLALQGRVGFPTSTVDLPLGADKVGWEVAGIVDKDIGKWLLALNLGYRGGPDTKLENTDLDDFATFRAAVAYGATEKAGVALEFAGDVPLADLVLDGMPIETMLSGYGEIAPGVDLRGGLGTSLTRGIAAPDLRALLGFSFTPGRVPSDADGDGILDKNDECPEVAEDLDGEADLDGCPENIGTFRVSAVDADGNPLPEAMISVTGTELAGKGEAGGTVEGGDFSAVAELDGYEPAEVSFVVADEDTDKVVKLTLKKEAPPVGSLRVTVKDADGNLVAATVTVLEEVKEGETVEFTLPLGETTVRAEAPGFRPERGAVVTITEDTVSEIVLTLEPAKAELVGERITIRESVFFETNKAVIQERSAELMQEVANILVDHPEITLMRIEGHTDSRGSASYNKQLSDRRAAAVKTDLETRGVAPERLESVGFGEEKPLAQGNNEAAWSKNRRVDFFVAERSDGPPVEGDGKAPDTE